MQNRFFTAREQWMLLGLAGAILLGAAVLAARDTTGAPPPQAETFAARATPAPALPEPHAPRPPGLNPAPEPVAPPPEPIGVGILGAVEKPGLYFFDPGARVQDLLDAAGGPLPGSDLSDINRSALLADETTLLVPRLARGEGGVYSDPANPHNPPAYTRSAWYQLDQHTASHASPDTAAGPNSNQRASANQHAPTGRININTASQTALESLPGIGPATAAKIIAHRRQQPFRHIDDLENVSGIGPAKMATLRTHITVY